MSMISKTRLVFAFITPALQDLVCGSVATTEDRTRSYHGGFSTPPASVSGVYYISSTFSRPNDSIKTKTKTNSRGLRCLQRERQSATATVLCVKAVSRGKPTACTSLVWAKGHQMLESERTNSYKASFLVCATYITLYGHVQSTRRLTSFAEFDSALLTLRCQSASQDYAVRSHKYIRLKCDLLGHFLAHKKLDPHRSRICPRSTSQRNLRAIRVPTCPLQSGC